MAVYSIIKLSELEGAKRIDAEYYKPEYLELMSKIKSQKSKVVLKDLVNQIVSGSYVNTYFNEGTLYLRVNNITEDGFDLSDLKFVDINFSKIPKKILVKTGDIVLGRTGTIGISHLVDERVNNAVMSQHITKVIINEGSINKHYLVAYLNSKFARKQMEREALGSMQVELTLDATRNLLIITPLEKLQKEIGDLVKKNYNLKRQSENLYSQAENLLLEELGLKDFKPEYEKTYTANLSDAFSAHRIDAEYFQPAFEQVIEKIKKYPNGFKRLLKYVENVKPDFDPTKHPEQTFSYVELADIDSSIGIIHSINEIKGEEAPSRARRILKDQDVIVSSVEGSLEKVALIDKEHDGCLASTGFFQFRPLDILPEVLLILSKTIVLQSQLKKKCSGTILTAVPKESLRNIIIPLLPLKIQQKIASLVQQSHEARRKAKELLEVAKKAVEIAIEKNENEALDYIAKAEGK